MRALTSSPWAIVEGASTMLLTKKGVALQRLASLSDPACYSGLHSSCRRPSEDYDDACSSLPLFNSLQFNYVCLCTVVYVAWHNAYAQAATNHLEFMEW